MPKLLLTFPDGSGDAAAHDLTASVVTVGRSEGSTIRIEDPSVSSHHARLTPSSYGGDYQLRDLGSTNGTRVNGKLVKEVLILRSGDRVRFGKVEAMYANAAGTEALPTGEDAGTAVVTATPEGVARAVGAVARHSRRPASFAPGASSPLQGRRGRQREPRAGAAPVDRVLLTLAGLAFLGFLVALFFVYRFQPPPVGLPT